MLLCTEYIRDYGDIITSSEGITTSRAFVVVAFAWSSFSSYASYMINLRSLPITQSVNNGCNVVAALINLTKRPLECSFQSCGSTPPLMFIIYEKKAVALFFILRLKLFIHLIRLYTLSGLTIIADVQLSFDLAIKCSEHV